MKRWLYVWIGVGVVLLGLTAQGAVAGVYPRADREQARTWYLREWPRGHAFSTGFTGDLVLGQAGDTSPEWKEATLARINLYRRVAGLQPLSLKAEYNRLCQAGALILGAQGDYSHAPPTSWPWWSQEGFTGCQQSNIGTRYPTYCPILDFMNDYGVKSVGHREALLSPGLRFTGVGAALHRNLGSDPNAPGSVVLVHVNDSSWAKPDPDYRDPFVLWPAAGFFPNALMTSKWTVTLADYHWAERTELDLAGVSLAVTRNGVSLPAAGGADITGARMIFVLDGDAKGEGSQGKVVNGVQTPYFDTVAAVGADQGYGEVRAFGLNAGHEDPFADVVYQVRLTGIRVRATGALWRGTGIYEYEVRVFDHQAGPSVPGQSRLVNLSTRSPVRTGASVQIAGFVVSGTKPKSFLVRASGPGLAPFPVGDWLVDPVVTLHRLSPSGEAVWLAENDDWGSDGPQADALREVARRAGAFAWTEGSHDAALLMTLAPGNYSATVHGKAGAIGTGLVEVYDAEPDNSDAHLVNLSSRTFVGDDGNTYLIAGFVLKGQLPRTLFLRATGPDLEKHGVTGVLRHPRMVLYEGEHSLWETDSYKEEGSTSLKAYLSAEKIRHRQAEGKAGAFVVEDGKFACVMLRTLVPDRNYTLIVKASGPTIPRGAESIPVYPTGNALVEIYEMP